MENVDLKQEAIKKAYGEHYESCSPDENGWTIYGHCTNESVNISDLDIDFTDLYKNIESEFWRPKSLAGIENNNGWIRILEDGSNLPELGGDYNVIRRGKIEQALYLKNNRWFCGGNDYPKTTDLHKITHYQPIIKPKLPIY